MKKNLRMITIACIIPAMSFLHIACSQYFSSTKTFPIVMDYYKERKWDPAQTVTKHNIALQEIETQKKIFNAIFIETINKPNNKNCETLSEHIKNKKTPTSHIAKTVNTYLHEASAEFAIKRIADEHPYLFYINNMSPISFEEAEHLMTLGFMTPEVTIQHEEKKIKMPLALASIYSLQADAELAQNIRPLAFKFLKTLLDSQLSPFYQYRKKTEKKNMYAIVKESSMSNEDKDKMLDMFNEATKDWSEQDKTNTTSMFRNGSQFNFTEKGQPFVLAEEKFYSITKTPQTYYCEKCGYSDESPSPCKNPYCC